MQSQLEIIQRQNAEAVLHHEWVGYEQIADHVKRAVIASEDATIPGTQRV